MRLLELQLGRVLDGDDALLIRNKNGKRVEERSLSSAGAADDDDVELGLDGPLEQFHHPGGERLLVHQVLRHQLVGSETADGEQRPIHCERRNDGVDAASIAQPGVHHGVDSSTRRPTCETILSMMRSRC